jgi:hypothetical protein
MSLVVGRGEEWRERERGGGGGSVHRSIAQCKQALDGSKCFELLHLFFLRDELFESHLADGHTLFVLGTTDTVVHNFPVFCTHVQIILGTAQHKNGSEQELVEALVPLVTRRGRGISAMPQNGPCKAGQVSHIQEVYLTVCPTGRLVAWRGHRKLEKEGGGGGRRCQTTKR